MWDVTGVGFLIFLGASISTHTSRVGCDEYLPTKPTEMQFLLTHPVWDVTQACPKGILPTVFLLTHPVWDVTSLDSLSVCPFGFLLTHPVWDVTEFMDVCVKINLFLLTHPVWDVTAIYSIFQSHYSHILQDGPIIHLELY